MGTERKPGRTSADVDGESANQTNPPLRPGLYVAADNGGGNGAGADGRQAGSVDHPPQPDEPELVSANEGENDRGGGEVDVDGRKPNPMDSRPHPDVDVGEEDGQIHSRSSTPSIPCGGESDGALNVVISIAALITPSGNIDITVPDGAPEIPHPNEAELSPAAGETTLGSGSTVTVELLCAVRDSANGFGPLKSVAGGLYLVLGNCKVCFPPTGLARNTYNHPSKQWWMNEP